MPVRQVAEPLDAVGQEWDRVTHRESLERPAVVPDHHLVETDALFGAPDEDVPPQLRDSDHDAGLAHEPGICLAVIHDPCLPRDRTLRFEAPAEHQASVPDLESRLHVVDLLSALGVLGVRRKVHQDSGPDMERREPQVELGSMEVVPPDRVLAGIAADRGLGCRITGCPGRLLAGRGRRT
jgi:hypothetical protein